MSGYTQHIEDHYWGYISHVQKDTKLQLQTLSDLDMGLTEALEQFRIDYTCSARRFLLNYFQRHASSVISETGQFTYAHGGNIYMFTAVSDDAVQHLDVEERDAYIKLICEISAASSGDSAKEWRPLARKAMLWNKRLDLLSKEEAFRLGHGLRFSLEEMNDFLLRVLDNEDLSYSRSSDVIEAFCFLYEPANNWHIADRLRQEYAELSRDISKQRVEDKPEDFSFFMETTLQSQIQKWEDNGLDVLSQFMDWLVLRAPLMDIPSRSAFSIYRGLALFAYRVTTDPQLTSDEASLSEQVARYCKDHPDLEMSTELIYKVSDKILSTAALEFDNIRKRQSDHIWRYLTVDKNGNTTAVAIGSRIPHLLRGDEAVTKADVLFMLWYICDMFWLESRRTVNHQLIYDRVTNFWSTAESLLEMARLPGFYAPHLLERSFLTAICTQDAAEDYPFEVYEGMCEFVLPDKQTRKREKRGSRIEKSRAILEKETYEAYSRNEIDFEGIARFMRDHVMSHGAEKTKYSFSSDGIACSPNPEIIYRYPMAKTGARFDQSAAKYMTPDVIEARFRFIYGLALYLMDAAAKNGITCDFRTNYQKNVALTIIRWER